MIPVARVRRANDAAPGEYEADSVGFTVAVEAVTEQEEELEHQTSAAVTGSPPTNGFEKFEEGVDKVMKKMGIQGKYTKVLWSNIYLIQ